MAARSISLAIMAPRRVRRESVKILGRHPYSVRGSRRSIAVEPAPKTQRPAMAMADGLGFPFTAAVWAGIQRSGAGVILHR
jgi:hypothetical protein